MAADVVQWRLPTMPQNPDVLKAQRLRRRLNSGAPLPQEDADWLVEYENRTGRFLSSHKLAHVEEHVVTAEGAAAEVAASAAREREEGRRLDRLLETSNRALVKACEMHQVMSKQLLEQTTALIATTNQLLVSVRTHYLALAEAEAEAIKAEAESGRDPHGLEAMAQELLPHLIEGMKQRKTKT